MLLIDAVLGDCPLRTLINIASLTWMCIQPCVYYTWITLPKFRRAWCRFDVMVRQHFSNLDDCAIKLIQRVHTSFMQYLSTTNGTHTWFFSTNLPLLLAPIKKNQDLVFNWDACVRRKSETGETQMKMISITKLWKKGCMCIWCVDANTQASTKSPRVCMKQCISNLGDLPFEND